MLKALTTKTTTTENPDGTITTTTTTFTVDGKKHVKRKTSPKKVEGANTKTAAGGEPFAPSLPLDNGGNNNMKRVSSSGSGMNRVSSSGSMKSAASRKSSSTMRRSASASSLKLFPKDERGLPSRSRSSSKPRRSSSFRNLLTVADMVVEVKQELVKILGVGHTDDVAFAKKASRAIPCHITLIASQDDMTQSQEGNSVRTKYNLPKTVGNSEWGSLATSALLQILHENKKKVIAGACAAGPISCQHVIKEIQSRVKKQSSLQEANPVISSSRPLGPPAIKDNKYAPFYLVPPGYTGKRRALLISVVTGEGPDLKGPPNDVAHVHYFLTKHGGFKDEDIVILRDDADALSGKDGNKQYKRSTKANILEGFANLVKQAKPNDVLFIQFSGHGGRLGDDLYINPSDYKTNGQIMDYDILRDLTKNLPAKTYCSMLVDCCYSGCIGDLPYQLHSKPPAPAGSEGAAGGQQQQQQEIDTYYDVQTRQEMIDNEGSAEQQQRKQARNKWRNVNRIATAAKAYAKEMAQDMGKAQKAATKVAKQAVDSGSDHLRSSVKAASKVASKGSDHLRSSMRSSNTSNATNNSDEENTKPTNNNNLRKFSRRASTGSNKPTMDVDPSSDSSTNRLAKRRSSMTSKSPPPPTSRPSVVGPIPRNSRSKTDLTQAAKEAAALQNNNNNNNSKNNNKNNKQPPRRAKSSVAKSSTTKLDDLPTPNNTSNSNTNSPPKAKVPPRRAKSMDARKPAAANKKTLEEMAREKELADRAAAVRRSQKEAAQARAAASK